MGVFGEGSVRLDSVVEDLDQIRLKMRWLQKMRNQYLYAQRKVTLIIKELEISAPCASTKNYFSSNAMKMWYYQSCGIFSLNDIYSIKLVIEKNLEQFRNIYTKNRETRKALMCSYRENSART